MSDNDNKYRVSVKNLLIHSQCSHSLLNVQCKTWVTTTIITEYWVCILKLLVNFCKAQHSDILVSLRESGKLPSGRAKIHSIYIWYNYRCHFSCNIYAEYLCNLSRVLAATLHEAPPHQQKLCYFSFGTTRTLIWIGTDLYTSQFSGMTYTQLKLYSDCVDQWRSV